MAGRLEGKTAVITGGNSGIGLATAKAFVREGARVMLFGRDSKSLETAAEALGDRASAVQGDVTVMADLDRLFDSAATEFGGLDVLHVNAGIAPMAPVAQVDEELFDKVFAVNTKGAFFTAQKALPVLREGASIVFTTSISNQLGAAGASVYAASKAAVRSLVRSLAAELLPMGVRVNAVSPGPVATGLLGRLGFDSDQVQVMHQQMAAQVPMKRIAEAEEVAAAVLFLASDEASFVVGAEYTVAGGVRDL